MDGTGRYKFAAFFGVVSQALLGVGCTTDWDVPAVNLELEFSDGVVDVLEEFGEDIKIRLLHYGTNRKPWDSSSGIPIVGSETFEIDREERILRVPPRSISVYRGNESRGGFINVISTRNNQGLNLLSCEVVSFDSLDELAGEPVKTRCTALGER